MAFDPVVVFVVLVLVVALGLGGTFLVDRAGKRQVQQVNANRREERAQQERLEQERLERAAKARKEESEALEGARREMALAQEELARALQAFHARHDQLVAQIVGQARADVDARFQQKFGITRPPKAANPEDDPEVQEYLREHYAQLRDAVLAQTMRALMDAEVDRRLAALAEGTSADDAETAEEAPRPEAETEGGTPAEREADARADEEPGAEEPQAEPEHGTAAEPEDESEDKTNPEPSGEADSESGAGLSGKAAPESESESEPAPSTDTTTDSAPPQPDRAPIEEAVREEFDLDGIRTYLLAAISARYDADGRPIGDLPWPAYTEIGTRGYGELTLGIGAPTYAQDAYREFAWRKFHTGKRAEKPTRGEYSWPASHELGDGIAVEDVPTPAGVFTVQGPSGALPLHELLGCAWMRHSMDYQGALLLPDAQRSFFVDLAGLHKDDTITLSFAGEDFLQEAEDGPFFLNAVGEVNGAHVGVSASKPEAANLGEAPYELAERTPTALVFRMTHDARRPDADTYPQFLEVHLAWCQPPAPRPDKVVRHVAN